MLICLSSLKSETAVTNKLVSSNRKNEAERRKPLYIDMKVDTPLDNQVVDLIV